ncbi:MAG: 8-oxo-dGTP diphosphatase [Candidatus Pacebacteria bacterium]|nr:8-oxo-dGTP diphosphatase [Candidatus Paceibacterota bacterium]
MKKILNLCLIADAEKILLGMKKRGWGEGRWNGFGGKVEEGETIEQSAKREMLEESGIIINGMEERGVIEFTYLDTGKIMEVHIFHVSDYEGEPKESEEMKPQWFNINEIPFESMWPDDAIWMPMFLAGKKFQGVMTFQDTNTIVSHDLREA